MEHGTDTSFCKHQVGEIILSQVLNVLQIKMSRSPALLCLQDFARTLNCFHMEMISHMPNFNVANFTEPALTMIETYKCEAIHNREGIQKRLSLELVY